MQKHYWFHSVDVVVNNKNMRIRLSKCLRNPLWYIFFQFALVHQFCFHAVWFDHRALQFRHHFYWIKILKFKSEIWRFLSISFKFERRSKLCYRISKKNSFIRKIISTCGEKNYEIIISKNIFEIFSFLEIWPKLNLDSSKENIITLFPIEDLTILLLNLFEFRFFLFSFKKFTFCSSWKLCLCYGYSAISVCINSLVQVEFYLVFKLEISAFKYLILGSISYNSISNVLK